MIRRDWFELMATRRCAMSGVFAEKFGVEPYKQPVTETDAQAVRQQIFLPGGGFLCAR